MNDSLEKIYKEVPSGFCKGFCTQSCGPVVMSKAEEVIIIKKHRTLPDGFNESLTCDKLKDKKCSIYEDRPLICRLFGATKQLKCPFNCKPAQGFITDRKAKKLLNRCENLK